MTTTPRTEVDLDKLRSSGIFIRQKSNRQKKTKDPAQKKEVSGRIKKYCQKVKRGKENPKPVKLRPQTIDIQSGMMKDQWAKNKFNSPEKLGK